MNRSRIAWLPGLALGGLLGLALGTTTTLRARQGLAPEDDFAMVGPTVPVLVEAPPRSVAETRSWLRLQTVVPMNFPDGTTLEELVRLVRESTRDAEGGMPRGVPIFVDPQGLQDADKTIKSMVVVDIDGIPVGRALGLAIRPLGLVAELDKDGLLTITSTGCNDGAPISDGVANWQSFEGLREDVRALRAEVSALRRGLKPAATGPGPATASPDKAGPFGGSSGGFR